MTNWVKEILILCTLISSIACNIISSNGCSMEGISLLEWSIGTNTRIYDIFNGIVFERNTEFIDSINTVSFNEGLNAGPYFTVTHSDNRFVIATNDAFRQYEERETDEMVTVTVNFRCGTGSSETLVIMIVVTDTNNNPPIFQSSALEPTNEFVYTLTTPIAPGTMIPGCNEGITVRDIDLTTERIEFTLEENPYLVIEYDAAASTTPKQFIGILKTKTFIRSIPEPITLRITATDVDRTADPPISTNATITISGDTEFEFPEEPVFSQTFYLADYTKDNELILAEEISLQRGFDELVQFDLIGDFPDNFALISDGNRVSVTIKNPLAADVLREKQIFLVVRADREYTSGDSATIVVQLPEEVPLEFQRAHYEGTIESNTLRVPQLILTQGYDGEVVNVEILGEFASFFTPSIQKNLITLSMGTLTDTVINENNMIPLEIVASTEFSRAGTVVTLEIIKDDNTTPVFNRPMYTGSYDTEAGLTLEQIVFDQGYDETVELSLGGEHSSLFATNTNGPVVTLTTPGIPPEMFSLQRIELTLQATKPRTVGGTAAVIIDLPAARQLSFEESSYRGTLQDNVLSLQSIILSTGYDENVVFSVTGELASYFQITSVANQLTIDLRRQIPETVIQENNIIMLIVEASGLNAITATTTVLVDVIKEDTTTPVFSSNIYYGNYQSASVINIENINLAQGFGNDVTFELQGEHAQYFQVSNTGNNVVVTLRSTIPTGVIFNEKVLLYNIVANKPLTVGANAAISIQFPSELTEPAVMKFAQNSYQGVIENNALSVGNIILSTGYETGTDFLLSGELSMYFTIAKAANDVSISLNSFNPLPIDEIEASFIILELEARRERAVSVWTSVVIDLGKEETQSLVFTKPYYLGNYVEQTEELNVETISLAMGYDDSVAFQLEGEQSQWFSVSHSANTVTLTVPNAIPAAVLANNRKLVFVITAQRTGSVTARSTVVISLGDEDTINTFLGFGQVTYVGSVDATQIALPTITLSEGYTRDVVFSLHGDLSSHFVLSSEGAGVVKLTLPSAIPDQALPANRIISLQIRAAAPNALAAHASIVLEAIVEDSQRPQLVFNAPYYTGSYTIDDGLRVNSPITLAEGYDVAVMFGLEGEQSQWFSVSHSANTVTLTVPNAIPAAVLANNRKLVFVITAQRTGSVTARSTVVISLGDEDTINTFLGFGQVTYVGSVDATQIALPTITLSEGYTQDVVFSLHGDLSSHFVLSSEGAGVVKLTLPTAIPDQALPANRIISLQIRAAAPNALAAHATIVLEAIVEDSQRPQLVFNAPYYTGSYTIDDGLRVNSPITLAEGYDVAVMFGLEGEQSQWFSVSHSANTVTLTVPNAIPAAVLANNRKLVFVITAQRTGSVTARSTVVISLGDEDTINTFLGFGQVTYVGSVDATQIALPTITLSEGYTQDVVFSLHGDLSSHFVLSSEGTGDVKLTLPTAIPDQALPANRIISLQIRAAAPNALAAHATIVLEAIVEDSQRPQLVFNAPYYTGSYTIDDGLRVNSPITLAEGYDVAVMFGLEGEQSQWFSVSHSANTVTLTVPNAIPAAVLANNRKLVFVITAQRTGTVTARSTVVISLGDEDTINTFLGFGQVTYVGSVDATQIALPTITLSEGYTQDVVFSLHGDLSSHFVLSSEGAGVVKLTLPTAIPDQALPANRIISLQIRAAAPNALAAHATIVLEAIVEDSQRPQLVFNAPYYTGSYTIDDGLRVNSPITLAEGYDVAVMFGLEGEQSQWFSVSHSANTVTLTVPNAIPAAVLANNRKLVFVITAQRTGSVTARSTVVISLGDEDTINTFLGFGQVTYVGSVDATQIALPTITLSEGYTQDVVFSLHGDLSSHFVLSSEGAGVVKLTLPTAIPDQALPANRIISLQIRAAAPNALAAHATIVLEAIVEDSQRPQLVFNAPYYTGSYTIDDGLRVNSPITLAEGYDVAVMFGLEGEQSQWFSVSHSANTVTLTVPNAIPAAVLANNRKLVFVITAQRTGSVTARSTVVISLDDEDTINTFLGFGQVTYVGSVDATQIALPTITLSEGYTQDVVFSLHGDLSSHFVLSSEGTGVVKLTLPSAIPDQTLPANRIISLQIRAAAPNALAAHATIVLEAIVEDSQRPQLVFNAPYYTGSYTIDDGLRVNSPITLAEGYDVAVMFGLEGEQSQWFSVSHSANTVTLTVPNAIPAAVLANNRKLVFVITAQRTGSVTARSTVVISLGDEDTINTFLGFGQVTYVGSVDATQIALSTITLSEGYTQDVVFSLHGDLSSHFVLSSEGAGVVKLTLPTAIPDQALPANRIISLQIRAAAPNALAAHATIVLEAIVEDSQRPQLVFNAPYYTGSYTIDDGLRVNSPITLAEGYDVAVMFGLEGEQSQWFSVSHSANTVTLTVPNAIPAAVLANNRKLVFVITAQRKGSVTARSTVIISLEDDLQTGDDVSFGKLVYEGIFQLNTVQHELIIISNSDGVFIQLHGEYASLFVVSMSDGVVSVQRSGSLTLPEDVTQVVLELHASGARAILLLNVVHTDVPVLPSVSFSSPSYILSVEIVQTGLIGRVLATADNGEAVTYSLNVADAHLQARVSINNEGELHLSAAANSGVYTFTVIATTVITRAQGTATVYLTVEAVTTCGDDEIVVPPLIILDRDEEQPHLNLVTLNNNQFPGCYFTLTNRWPLDQNWLYVDSNGLHARSIDREHESIAFMALSQVQVELVLHCENDNAARTKRSPRTDLLGPYDYGSNKWILTESIPYNARRSLINLIVNDINDNAPIFVGKELEPIAVGYPIGELEERILPRALAELQVQISSNRVTDILDKGEQRLTKLLDQIFDIYRKATDADIGENAALMYLSEEDVLAVEPTTGFVHVRSGALMQNDQRLIVKARDQNGKGLTGEIQLLVKLLDLNNIVVVTVKDAFLSDEKSLLVKLSEAVGYEVKVLKSVVVSDDRDQNIAEESKNNRDGSTGASLLLYVYGLVENVPVVVDRLTADINNNAAIASVISTISLEDHLEPAEVIISEREIGLLVATIVLSVLLFIIMVLIAIWFFLRWRKNKNYDEFADENSIVSRNESLAELPKPVTPKPRLNIEDLKKSEKRLQDMLNAPIEEVTVEAMPKKEAPMESIIDLPTPEVGVLNAPIVIQSIDKLKNAEDSDEDEFGEKFDTVPKRKKSVVTFNENVEKIIHLEDDADSISSQSSYEIYRL